MASSGFAFHIDSQSGVPIYRQLIDQVMAALATSALRPGDRLPTVRQVAVDLSVNPNTVVRAYRELEIRAVLATQQGTGTFIAENPAPAADIERDRRLTQLAGEAAARAGAAGFTLDELIARLGEMRP